MTETPKNLVSAAITGAGGLVTMTTVTYILNTDVGTATADATYGGDANHLGSTATQVTFDITKAPSTVTVAALSVEYDGAAHPTTALVSGVGTGIMQSVTWAYTGNCSAAPINVSETLCTATATYAGDSNHDGSSGFNTITITKAPTTTTLTFETGPYVYRGTLFTATADASGTGNTGFTASVAPVYSGDCLNVTVTNGCTATATYAGDNNHTSSSDIESITITKATATVTVTGFSGTYDGLPHGVVSSSASGVLSESLTGLSIDTTTYRNVPGGSVNWSFTNQNYADQSGRRDRVGHQTRSDDRGCDRHQDLRWHDGITGYAICHGPADGRHSVAIDTGVPIEECAWNGRQHTRGRVVHG